MNRQPRTGPPGLPLRQKALMFLGTLFSLGDRSVWCRFHFFTGWQIHSLKRMCVCVCVCARARTHLVVQLCLTLCDPMDCSLPGFSVHGISWVRILEWVAISCSVLRIQHLLIFLQHLFNPKEVNILSSCARGTWLQEVEANWHPMWNKWKILAVETRGNSSP